MADLTYYVAVSLDGFIAAPDGDFSGFATEGEHIEALLREYPETFPGAALDALGVAPTATHYDSVVMGWNTYAVGLPFGATDPYPHLRTTVFTRDPHRRRGETGVPARVDLTNADPLEHVRAVKQRSVAGVWLCGGGRLAAALADEIDELVLKVNPIVLGDGIPLFAAPHAAARFALTDSSPYTSGVVISRYRRITG